MASISLESLSLSPISMPVSSIFSLAFLKRDQLDVKASISDNVDEVIADTQIDMWLVLFSWLITAVGWFLKRGG